MTVQSNDITIISEPQWWCDKFGIGKTAEK
jgi:hypothetical protein